MLQSTLMASQLIPMVRLFSQAFAYCVLRSKYLVLKGISGRTVNNWQVISTDETSTSTSLTPVWICVPPACWRPLLLQVQLFWVQCPFFLSYIIHQNQFLWNLGWGTGHAVAGTCLISCRMKLSRESDRVTSSPKSLPIMCCLFWPQAYRGQ